MITKMAARTARPASEAQEVSLFGHALLDNPLLNKGSAFTEGERREFGLLGLLPPHASTIEEQLARAYENYRSKQSDIERYIFLVSLQDRNETLFYRLLQEHIAEMLPVIYTPVVGNGCLQYSHIYRRPRGLYVAYPNRHDIDAILSNTPARNIEAIVVTDGERVLGLGDLGVGGMGIPVGKLALYTLCAGIHPAMTLPILLDVGTNNRALLEDPLYLGWRHERVCGKEYDGFIEAFVEAVRRRFPSMLLQWEDFARHNASRLLEKFRDHVCSFNDDIQGTGAVTLAGLMAATRVTGSSLGRQRIVILGAGSAAAGIAGQIVSALTGEGLSREEARSNVWLVDVDGLLHTERRGIDDFVREYAQPLERASGWQLARPGRFDFKDVIRNVRPTVLIGVSAAAKAFTGEIVREMASYVERPIIFPLSNPTSKSEAAPSDLVAWTAGRAVVATGSPYPEMVYGGQVIRFGQCNNALIFPGVGLGVIASGARRVTDEMFTAAARALARLSPSWTDPLAPLYPGLERVREVSREVALAVGREAQRAGVAPQMTVEDLGRRIDQKMWTPRYVRYRKHEA